MLFLFLAYIIPPSLVYKYTISYYNNTENEKSPPFFVIKSNKNTIYKWNIHKMMY